jgi:hypothetical protein
MVFLVSKNLTHMRRTDSIFYMSYNNVYIASTVHTYICRQIVLNLQMLSNS